jgi:hypothetical protein
MRQGLNGSSRGAGEELKFRATCNEGAEDSEAMLLGQLGYVEIFRGSLVVESVRRSTRVLDVLEGLCTKVGYR